jgi:hypothetical protein
MDTNDLRREPTCRLRHPFLEQHINSAAVIIESAGPVSRALAQVPGTIERDPSETEPGRARLFFEVSEASFTHRRSSLGFRFFRTEEV